METNKNIENVQLDAFELWAKEVIKIERESKPIDNRYIQGVTDSLKEYKKIKKDTDVAFDISEEILKLYKTMPDCNLKKHLDLWFSI